MLSFILQNSLEMIIYISKNIYTGTRYLLYGPEDTEMRKLEKIEYELLEMKECQKEVLNILKNGNATNNHNNGKE